jgi:asparagine synthase (glutamine-hydrolysing)
MCGFVGILKAVPLEMADELKAAVLRMTNTLAHRGPDDAGTWCDADQGIALGHRRLSILDLSPAGHQPMQSASRRYMLVFNGEIYNHLSMRKMLESGAGAPAWRGGSDTETLLAGFDAWGIRATVERTVGMFAFAVWDRQTHTLTLGRDRIGEKPLYYGWQGQGDKAAFLFGSELKALRAHPAFDDIIDRNALCLQMRHSYVPAPYSIYQGIAKLTPGCLLTISTRNRHPKESSYWSAVQHIAEGVAKPFDGTAQEAVDQLETMLSDSVRAQMIADVPLGAFLSGGIDSSTVVALMQAHSTRPVKTFSIGFHEADYNEAGFAKAVASHLGTDHTELYVTAGQARAVIPDLQTIYDEPFSDSSQLPTLLVSRLARQHVTVSLSGDAGDELFCGYNRYQFADSLWNKISAGPLFLRRLAARGITGISIESWNRMARLLSRGLPRAMRFQNTGDKLHKGAQVMTSASLDALYLGLVSHWNDPASLVIGGTEPPTALKGDAPMLSGLNGVQRMMALDLMSYLPDDILVKVDRAAMSVSLETRVPFLDHRVVEFAWRLPQSLKLRNGVTKWALRQVLSKYVPASLIDRPKMGFGIPVGDWLRGALRDWGEALLSESRLRNEGFFHTSQIRKCWEEHVSGQRNWQYQLWDVLMFQAWLEQQQASTSRPISSAGFPADMCRWSGALGESAARS